MARQLNQPSLTPKKMAILLYLSGDLAAPRSDARWAADDTGPGVEYALVVVAGSASRSGGVRRRIGPGWGGVVSVGVRVRSGYGDTRAECGDTRVRPPQRAPSADAAPAGGGPLALPGETLDQRSITVC
ncbi:hypothetical protein GN958_ATG15495 [Phytophthora infestans]|uniref:Uncharacterized protein n=1 Tax=Phytophthora infestans TaxID=4787 RepID=A0A8S9U7B8_PHYIN|nr:hypothetical protein GN958_ATG15495 [Phytophthora infestans]